MSIPVFKPYLGAEELEACQMALQRGYLGMGSFVGDFENELSTFLKLEERKHIVTCSTGHAALHMALMLIGVGLDDEVITPSFNNIADFQAITAVGAKPVFCDVLSDTLCIDPSRIERLVGPNTKAIIAMDYGACIADHRAIHKIADYHGIPVIHDAAHSFGSFYENKPIGHQAAFTMFSFDPIKNITCIDGGALVVNSTEHAQKLREMRLIGMTQRTEKNYQNTRDWLYDVNTLGFRYHMANLHAAIGSAQLKKSSEIFSKRRSIYTKYFTRLSRVPGIQLQKLSPHSVVPFIMCIRVKADVREGLVRFLGSKGIETGLHWRPGHTFTLYRECISGPLDVTNTIANQIISLPFFPELSDTTLNEICDNILEYMKYDSNI